MKLYFTRHGKTEWNKDMRFQGREGDSPLLPESYKEIKQLGNHLKDISFEAIYSSPMMRASKTAKGICNQLTTCPEIIYSDALKELGLGELEGTKIVDSREKYAKEMWALRNDPSQYSSEKFQGEIYQEMLERSTNIVKQAIEETEQGPILFVSHGVTLGACIQTLIGTPLADLRKQGSLTNNSLSILDYTNGKFTLEVWNDDSYLNK